MSFNTEAFIESGEKTSLQIDLDDQNVTTKHAEHYSAFAILRKRSFGWLPIFGDVYFLEKKKIDGKTTYGLFGGGIEHTDPTKMKSDVDRTSAGAIARELDEEIGNLSNKNGREFSQADFNIMATLVGKSIDGREIAVDVWDVDDSVTARLSIGKIEKHQRILEMHKAELEEKLSEAEIESEIQETKNHIKRVNEIIAGKPIKIRRFFGLWVMVRLSFAFPIPMRIRPNWFRFTPIAAYALMADARMRERKR